MITKEFFLKNQRSLVKLANTEAGRLLLKVKSPEPIIEVLPHGYKQFIGRDSQGDLYRVVLFWEDICFKLAYPLIQTQISSHEFGPINNEYEAFLHFSGLQIKDNKYPQIFLGANPFVSSTFKSGAGRLTYENVATFSGWRADSTGTQAFAGIYECYVDHGGVSGTFQGERVYLPQDTSSIGLGARPVGIQFDCIAQLSNTTDAPVVVAFTQTAQVDTTTLTTAEWGNKGAGANGGTMTHSLATTAAKSIVGNPTAVGFINIGGVSLFGLREYTHDLLNSSPTGVATTIMIITSPAVTITYYGPAGGIVAVI